MTERLAERISDNEVVFERPGPTANIFAHVYKPASRTNDDWQPCCEKATLAEIQTTCRQYRQWP